MSPVTDYYSILSVSRDATTVQIRDRFRQLARERHPDRFQGEAKQRAEQEFQLLTQAANVLLDPDKRRGHDMELFQPEVVKREEEAKLSKMLMQRGRLAYKSRNYVEAVDNFQRAATEDPKNPHAWYYLARACRHNRRWLSQGVAAITSAIKLEPGNADYYKLAGDLCARANMMTRAQRFYREALNWGADEDEVRAALERLDMAVEKRGQAR